MGRLNVIRKMALRQRLPIREIARRTGLSRNTIKRDLKAGIAQQCPVYGRPRGYKLLL